MNESTLQNKTIANLKVFNSDSLKVLVRTKTLYLLIQNELICIILENLNISKEQYENELKIFKSNNKLLLEEDFQSWLKTNNQTEQNLELNLINELKYEIYRNENFSHKVEAEYLSLIHISEPTRPY